MLGFTFSVEDTTHAVYNFVLSKTRQMELVALDTRVSELLAVSTLHSSAWTF